MEFCPACDNKLYLNMKKSEVRFRRPPEGYSSFLYCKYCTEAEAEAEAEAEGGAGASVEGHEETEQEEVAEVEAEEEKVEEGGEGGGETEDDMCLYRSNYRQLHSALYFSTLVNANSLHDPTLPQLGADHETGHACPNARPRFVRYDTSNLKYIYLCDVCLDCYLLSAPNTPLFDWKLHPLEDAGI